MAIWDRSGRLQATTGTGSQLDAGWLFSDYVRFHLGARYLSAAPVLLYRTIAFWPVGAIAYH